MTRPISPRRLETLAYITQAPNRFAPEAATRTGEMPSTSATRPLCSRACAGGRLSLSRVSRAACSRALSRLSYRWCFAYASTKSRHASSCFSRVSLVGWMLHHKVNGHEAKGEISATHRRFTRWLDGAPASKGHRGQGRKQRNTNGAHVARS